MRTIRIGQCECKAYTKDAIRPTNTLGLAIAGKLQPGLSRVAGMVATIDKVIRTIFVQATHILTRHTIQRAGETTFLVTGIISSLSTGFSFCQHRQTQSQQHNRKDVSVSFHLLKIKFGAKLTKKNDIRKFFYAFS